MKKLLLLLAGLTLAVAATTAIVLAATGGGTGAAASDPEVPVLQYEVTVRFNTSVTQEGIEEVEALLRSYDDDLEFLIQESWPPTGRAFLEAEAAHRCGDAPGFCGTVKEQLEAKSYVSSVSCQLRQDGGDAEPDAPVEHRNDMID